MTEDELVGWHLQFNGDKFEQTRGDGERQGSLACSTPWGHKETSTTEQVNKIQAGGDWKADPNSNSIEKEADSWRQSGTCLGLILPFMLPAFIYSPFRKDSTGL